MEIKINPNKEPLAKCDAFSKVKIQKGTFDELVNSQGCWF
jgi:hypothetical protein